MTRIAALLASLALAAVATVSAAQNRWWDQRGAPGGPARVIPYRQPPPSPPYLRGPPPGYPTAPPPGMRPPGYPTAPPPGARPPNSLGAGWRQQQDEARSGVRRGALAPLGRVIDGIGRRTPGRQLDSGIEYEGGRAVYRVRWITTGGRRIDYIVDAASGAILRGGQ